MREVCFEASVSAVASASISYPELQAMRKTPPRFGDVVVQGHFLKHADEQAIVALEAIRLACERSPQLDVRTQSRWAVVSAPRYIGRMAAAQIVSRFDRSGTTGVPTHAGAHYSLNSVSGVVGIAMGIRGPNLGVGGGPATILEGLIASLTLFDTAVVPGVWLTLTGWSHEPLPDPEGKVADRCVCHGVALALQPQAAGSSQLRLRLPGASAPVNRFLARRNLDPSIAELAALVSEAEGARPADWFRSLPDGGSIELRLNAAAARLQRAA